MVLKQITPTLQVWFSTKPSKDKSYIADIDLADHCPEFWHKCYDILTESNDWAIKFVNSIMEFYDDWGYITWKQYDTLINIKTKHKNIKVSSYEDSLSDYLNSIC